MPGVSGLLTPGILFGGFPPLFPLPLPLPLEGEGEGERGGGAFGQPL